jgi:hypothetical protein
LRQALKHVELAKKRFSDSDYFPALREDLFKALLMSKASLQTGGQGKSVGI